MDSIFRVKGDSYEITCKRAMWLDTVSFFFQLQGCWKDRAHHHSW